MPTPTKRSIDEIKANLLKPALTSHFEVEIPIPTNIINNVVKKIGMNLSSPDLTRLNLSCTEASLPGSSLATVEINNDYTGVTERHAHRRLYDDRIDFTFYVDGRDYLPIVFFESWIKYIVGESVAVDEDMRGMGSEQKNYFYRMRYPDTYIMDKGLKITKFERDYRSRIEYEFIRSYPISITSMPVSYDSSNLLKCTVSMTYIRYVVRTSPDLPKDPDPVTGKTNSDIRNSLIRAQLEREAQLGITGQNGFGNPQLERAFQQTQGSLANQQFDINGRPIIDVPTDINGRPINP